MPFLILLAVMAAAPTVADVEAVEQDRVVAPYISYARDGSAVAEFAPNVVVRNTTCESTQRKGDYRCRYESRVSDWGRDDGAWTTREIVIRKDRKGCWREVG